MAAFRPEAPQVPDTLSGSTGLAFRAAASNEEPRTVQGRRGTAVAIDRGSLSGPAPAAFSNGFTAALLVKIHGQGGILGNNGASNGTIIAVGSGYSDGWRLIADTARSTLSFAIGRPTPPYSATASAGPLNLSGWRHIAVTWDRRRMRLWLDGRPVAERAMAESYTTPAANLLRIGYAGAGVGSLRLDVEEATIWDRALSRSEIARLAAGEMAAPRLWAERVDEADECLLAGDADGAVQAARDALRIVERTHRRLAVATGCLLIEAARRAGDGRTEVMVMADLAEAPDAEEADRAAAAATLAEALRAGRAADLAPSELERCVRLARLAAAEREEGKLLIVWALMDSGHVKEARRRVEPLCESADPVLKSMARLTLARLAFEAGESEAGLARLREVEAQPDAPLAHRDEAARLLASGGPRPPSDRLSPAPVFPEPGVEFHVSPDGDDANPGSRERPFATPARARDALREWRAKHPWPAGGAAITLAPGRYAIRSTLTLGPQDSGRPGAPVVWRARDPARPPMFDGGVRLTPRPVSAADRDRLAPESRKAAVELDLAAAGLTNLPPMAPGGVGSGRGFRTHPTVELFLDGTALPLSRWPNHGFAAVAAIHGTQRTNQHGRTICVDGIIAYDSDRPSRWIEEPALLLHGYWHHRWAESYEVVSSIDAARRRIEFARPWHTYGYASGGLWRAVNAISEIDEPGEWAFDPVRRRIIVRPPAEVPAGAEWVVPGWFDPFLKADNVTHLAMVGLVWQYGGADALLLQAATNCVLVGCTIRHFAGDALRVDGGCSNLVRSCDIHSLGRGGVYVSGGDRRTLQPGGHCVENCHIHHLSRLNPTYTPAVAASGVGHRIAHNLVHDVPSSAFRLAGNDHLVEMNEVFEVVTESDDQGGTDMWGDPFFRGNRFLHNYWHHIGDRPGANMTAHVGRAAIRLDDAISGTVIRGNVFLRCGSGQSWRGAVQIHGGKDNEVDGNVVALGPAAVSFTPWPEPKWQEHIAEKNWRRDIDLDLYARRYPVMGDLAAHPNRNLLSRNWVWRCERLTINNASWSRIAPQTATARHDTPFVAPERGDFRLRKGARPPACLGPEPIPFEFIGLRPDPYRAVLPDEAVRAARARVP